MSDNPDFIAARYAAVQRTLDMIKEAEVLRQAAQLEDWDWDKHMAIRAFRSFQGTRLAKIQRAAARRSARLRYLSRRDEYAQQTDPAYAHVTNADFVEFGWGGVTAGATWGEHTDGDSLSSCGESDAQWPPSSPALNDWGFWLTEERDKISPLIIPHPGTSHVTIVPLEL
ncbi:hypothetical protein R3P38DRAFT_2763615 [Favolaschia claudopus]|uniref:Uncharacterized protein n=1 Tax=Favolaschia claudopus TaxID=2862362 RepID=A0AAW0B1T7_9AGAR